MFYLVGPTERALLLNMLLTMLCGFVIGVERELKHKPAGINTHMLVMGAAMLFAFMSAKVGSDPSRIAAQIVSGVGFLGAGLILKGENGKVSNLTTAASVWYSAAVGMALGFNFHFVAIIATIYAFLVSRIPKFSRQT